MGTTTASTTTTTTTTITTTNICTVGNDIPGGNDNPGATCEFPWKHGGNLYYECANPDGGHGPWCGTVLYADLTVNKWGYCDANCFAPPRCTQTGDDWNCNGR